MELANCFENIDIIKHGGGHFIPASVDFKNKYNSFLEKQLRNLGKL